MQEKKMYMTSIFVMPAIIVSAKLLPKEPCLPMQVGVPHLPTEKSMDILMVTCARKPVS